MNAVNTDMVWDRWVALGRLQAQFLARSSELLSASLQSVCRRGERLIDLYVGTPWPWMLTRVDAPLAASSRWIEYLEDESRNAAQAVMLTDWEMRDWRCRFARTVEGESEK